MNAIALFRVWLRRRWISASIDRQDVLGSSLIAGLMLTVFTFAIVTTSGLALLTGATLSVPLAVSAVILGVVAAWGIARWASRGEVTSAAAIAILALGMAVALSRIAPDRTADGVYHGTAIAALLNGWNPVWHSYTDAVPPALRRFPFIDSYGKASWILAATLIRAGFGAPAVAWGSVYLPAAAALILFGTARRLGSGLGAALLIAAAGALNPIVLQEYWTKMNDGQMTSLITIFIAGQLLWMLCRDAVGLCLSLPAMTLAMNEKISGAPILVILCAFVVLAQIRVNGGKAALRDVGTLMVTGLVALTIIGASPYVSEPVRQGVLFQAPTSESDWAEMMKGDWPAGFEHMSPAQRWVRSFLSRTGYDSATLKLPFTVTREEILDAGDVEVMIAGLGPLFSTAVILSVFLAIWAACAEWASPVDPTRGALVIITTGIGAASILLPQSWYFRYVPHLWLLPIGLAIAASFGSAARRSGAALVLAIMLVNATLVGFSSLIDARAISAHWAYPRSW